MIETNPLTTQQERYPSSTWEQDYRDRTNPKLLTRLLRAGVPALAWTGWRVEETRPGYCRSVLPISYESSNQHGVHQAALIGLLADYNGGIALGSVLTGVPIIGVHAKKDEHGASLWAGTLSLEYKLPSSADLVAVTQIEPARWDRIRRRYASGNTVLERVTTSLWNGDREVASAEGTYFVRQSTMLRPASPSAVPHPLFEQKLKASARLIAALRARESARPNGLIRDPHAAAAAGDHGRVLAERLLAGSPQLQPMVAARTKHLDDCITATKGLEQIVLLGAGLDFRPLRLPLGPDVRVFEVDFPTMLSERERLLAGFQCNGGLTRHAVACDLKLEDLRLALLDRGFDPAAKTIFVNEGTSMYLDDEANASTLNAVASLMRHPESLLWIDYVRSDLFQVRHSEPSVDSFLDSMERLGEPFLFGVENSAEWLSAFGLTVQDDADAARYFPDLRNQPVYPLYRFAIARKATS